jgi:hypothetical protein
MSEAFDVAQDDRSEARYDAPDERLSPWDERDLLDQACGAPTGAWAYMDCFDD